ncbi:cupredoxin domain-containing protein [Ktedonospora formicarum]|uniref:Blue (type 1) copper domain-containing protein n=1 Tax=Ktedonospora formicarum TaxID=2778364 RepID=A0A8J3MVC3_9CHLR|nr:hypothetical protein [Ktedonospora formicarum]GHO50142.1 hypothetical protein KSX_83050 [Ktedonospora formicarum]
MNIGQIVVGIIILLVVVIGLLVILLSRTNAVQKTGYGSLAMLSLVAMMIPVFWIIENQNQASSTQKLQAYAIEQGVKVFVTNCTDDCYAIGNKDQLLYVKYLGYDLADLNKMTDNQLKALITAGSYNPNAPQPGNVNTIPRRDTFGGQLKAIDIDYLFALFRSAEPTYAKKQGYTGDAAMNGFHGLIEYLQANNKNLYDQAVTRGKNGQFGEAIDKTAESAITIHILPAGQVKVCTSSDGCFEYAHLKVKVGTKITWINEDKLAHTVTAIDSSNLSSPKALPDVFDSKSLETGKSFEWTVTDAAYNLDKDSHRVIYYCSVHPTMQAELEIVPAQQA